MVDVYEYRRLEICSRLVRAFAADEGACALRQCLGHVPLDDVELGFAGQRPDVGVDALAAGALAQAAHALGYQLDELVAGRDWPPPYVTEIDLGTTPYQTSRAPGAGDPRWFGAELLVADDAADWLVLGICSD